MAACDLLDVVLPSSRASGRKVEIAFVAKALPTSPGDAAEPDIGGVTRVWRLHDIARKAEIAERVAVERREMVLGADRSRVALPECPQAVQKGRAAGCLQRRRMGGAGHDVILWGAGATARFVRMNLGHAGRRHKAEDCHLP